MDDTYFVPRPVVNIWGEAFSPQTSIAPVYPDVLVPDSRDLGTVFLYSNWTVSITDVSSWEIEVFVDGEVVTVWISLDGYCTRIGTAENSAQAYCHYVYTVYDPATQMISGGFTAQGFLVEATFPGTLTVTGGFGLLTGASGIVEISPAILDNAMDPPMLASPSEGADLLDGVDGYVHYFELKADEYFFLPELYSTASSGHHTRR